MPTPTQVAKWLDGSVGKRYNTDGVYGSQCVDLINAFADYCKNPRIAGNAKDLWANANPKYYEKIVNTLKFVPRVGDIMVWGGWRGNPYGHTAIVKDANVITFKSLDQNWVNANPNYGSPAAYVRHTYWNPSVIGVLRPRNIQNAPAPKPVPKPAPKPTMRKVTITAPVANVRDKPTTKSPLSGSKTLKKGNVFTSVGIVKGENVAGNNNWHKSSFGNFIWAGNTNVKK